MGVYREQEFSPGKIGPDAAILDRVLDRLAAEGAVTSAMSAAELIESPTSDCDLVLAMCQSQPAIERLSLYQARGALVINSPASIRSCYRDRLGDALSRAGAPVPSGILVRTGASLDLRASEMDPRRGIYIKRGDLHALSSGDVQRVDDEGSLRRTLSDFAARGISHAYLQAAVEGRVVKFYGVTGTGYFSVAGDSAALSESLMVRLDGAAREAARALGLEVWGGDAIVDGFALQIVDFNDWPSFERVREPAAHAIAQRALQLLQINKCGQGGGER
jgi:hypothetical protein